MRLGRWRGDDVLISRSLSYEQPRKYFSWARIKMLASPPLPAGTMLGTGQHGEAFQEMCYMSVVTVS
jgi:hypothetical protein